MRKAFDEESFQIPHNRSEDLIPAFKELKAILDMIQSNLKLIFSAASNRVHLEQGLCQERDSGARTRTAHFLRFSAVTKVILQEHYMCADYKVRDKRPLSSARVSLEHVNLLLNQRS